MATTLQMNHHGGDDVSAIVIDLGSHTTRVGYGQEDSPKQWWNSVCGKSLRYTDDKGSQKLIFPLSFHTLYESVEVKHCVYSEGCQRMIDPDVFEHIVSRTCEGYILDSFLDHTGIVESNATQSCTHVGGLGVTLSEHPVLLSEPSKHSLHVRENMAEIMFEHFHVPALYLAKQAMLSSFSIGRDSGLIVDIGASGLTISPLVEGYVLQKCMLEYPFGGDWLDSHIHQSLIMDQNIFLFPFYGRKQKGGNSSNRLKGTSPHIGEIDLSRVHQSYLQYSQLEVIKVLKESICRVRQNTAIPTKWKEEKPHDIHGNHSCHTYKENECHTDSNYYELPDGTSVNVQKYKFDVGELLFQPQNIPEFSHHSSSPDFRGLPQAIVDCVLKCDVDIRKDMLNAIILTGGTSLMPGLIDRVNLSLHEDEALLSSAIKYKIVAPSTTIERRFGVWLGGSILASLGTFQQLWISRQDYDEHGIRILEKYCS
ncbi:actin like protein ALP2a [Cardiosporidium cionae]|uniref:Actin like protein ALP2a n=1 Tax=Cardiosporidium cionae TaxID=476202 RepID=A0ABQ7JF46_9APIC|nr:actin like protein ALP2a [Cardiosporidium cionae]|eukprot:KAF8822635.1 actin like protein ALP2a [Cardiosporidium cionae]